MAELQVVTASLEGARVLADGQRCWLQEYDFEGNRWQPKDEAAWPLTRERTEEWLAGWNEVDRYAATNLLASPLDAPSLASLQTPAPRAALRLTR